MYKKSATNISDFFLKISLNLLLESNKILLPPDSMIKSIIFGH